MRLLIALVILTVSAYSQTALTLVPMPPGASGVSVAGPDDPGFKAYVNSKVAPEQMAPFQAILPYSVIVRNDSAQPILGYYVLYQVVDAEGRSFNRGNMGGYVAGQVALAPGAATWLPIDGVYGSMLNFPNTKSFTRFVNGEIAPRQSRPISYYTSAKSVSVTLDSVLLADGTIAGPDSVQMASRFNSFLQGDIALSRAVLGFKNDLGGLQQYLDVQSAMNPEGDYENREMGRQARLIAAILKRNGLDAALASATSLYNAASSLHLH
jgi:hypothetical protein